MAGKKAAGKPRARRKKVVGQIDPLVTELNELQIVEMMKSCDDLAGRLSFLTFRLLIEQKQRAHERRMAALKQLGSAVAYTPVTLVKGVVSVGRGTLNFLKQRIATLRRPQEATS